ncbi:MAG TPA: FAD-dependent oxidoreductase [Xanthobacteraceae bacterium]|nr:FAD-dependent oxidoreductase [Xanthobacteraceae bacterium]
MSRTVEVDCCVVGGGPAGVMAGLLFARAGCKTLVLEKHADFLRDFRGDTVHPSTLENMRELGLLQAFLQRPHQRLHGLAGAFGGKLVTVADFSAIDAACRFIAIMPQWHFLDFLAGAAKSLPTFSIEMRAEGTELIEEDDRVRGVKAETPDGPLAVRARLVIGADGRQSTIRSCAGLKVREIGAPIDVLWFRVPRENRDGDEPLLNTGPGHIVITIDRGDYFQCALVIPKGEADNVKAAGLEAFRRNVAATAPRLARNMDAVASFDDVKLLTVKIDRLEQWSRPGLLMIGDSAHAMSPIGGVGINLAIQDAVAAANLLAGPLADGALKDDALDLVRRRRLWPTRATQFLQVQIQNRIVVPLLANQEQAPAPPLPLRIISKMPWLRGRAASFIGLGFRPEHVRSRERYRLAARVIPEIAAPDR